ncbi:hypothetical protein [Desulfosporosinus sp. SB140]|uniref:hypothetical protein n=1 Tax=Desulfosporosinus paludis TaxID=3115649 RepID=UPI00388F1226
MEGGDSSSKPESKLLFRRKFSKENLAGASKTLSSHLLALAKAAALVAHMLQKVYNKVILSD